MARTPAIESTSIESMHATVIVDADPTALTPEFVVTDSDATDPSGTWVDGSWGSTWAAETGRVVVTSATVGASGADFPVVEGSTYAMWMRVGTAVDLMGHFRVR